MESYNKAAPGLKTDQKGRRAAGLGQICKLNEVSSQPSWKSSKTDAEHQITEDNFEWETSSAFTWSCFLVTAVIWLICVGFVP